MTKRNWFLIFVALVLAGAYAFYFTDWFKPKIIYITHTSRNLRQGFRRNPNSATAATIPDYFKLARPFKLTEIKVVELDEWQTNNSCLPLWHLIAGTNSTLITQPFIYGQNIPSMKPEVPGERAQPLKPGVKYRLFVTDGTYKGEKDFQPVARPASQ